MAESQVIHVRKRKSLQNALDLANEKWPNLSQTELVQRITEQWVNLQNAGTSKTHKIASIDDRLAEQGALILAMSHNVSAIPERVSRLEEVTLKILEIVREMKVALADHGFEEE